MSGLNSRVVSGMAWVSLERVFSHAMHFVVSLVLARLLTPNDYGTVALLSIFFAIAGSIATCGFGNALVQKKQVTELDYNTVFYISLVASLVVYCMLYLLAPYIAAFYNIPVLAPITRVSALSIIFNAINSVQIAELSRKMMFDRRFKITCLVGVVSAAVGISLAYLGFGVWALVASSLLGGFVGVIAYWRIIAWRPMLMFDLEAAKSLFSYGWKMSFAGLIHTFYTNMYGFLVGRYYSPNDLAFVNRGNAVPNLFLSAIDGTISNVSFPALSKMQDSKKRIVDAMRKMIQCSTFLVFFCMGLVAVCAEPLVVLMYGEQWKPAAVYIPICCFAVAMTPLCTINCNAIAAIGKSGVYLWMEIIKKTSGLILMCVSIHYGVIIFVLTISCVQVPIAVLVNTFSSGRFLGYTFKKQLQDVMSSFLICAAMIIAIRGFQLLIRSFVLFDGHNICLRAIILLATFMVGSVVYFGLACIFRTRPFVECIMSALPFVGRRLSPLAVVLRKLSGSAK